ncbi:MAG: sigma-70 family RNA polymerase sigma factor [Cytophagaceae bacterium]|nr:MAG: sigma-70 family RNA polymerase sigma factor [Cytophagaceae bacterium]
MKYTTYESMPDALLWDKALRNDKSAYSYLYEKFAPILYNYSYRFTSDRAFTEDCVQELFLRLLEGGNQLSKTDSIKFYLFRSIRREIVRRLATRHQQTLPLIERDIDFRIEFAHEPGWLENRISDERSQALLTLVNDLPARQKEAIFLRFYDELPYQEVAQVMGINQLSAYKTIYKALANLHRKMPVQSVMLLLLALLLQETPS